LLIAAQIRSCPGGATVAAAGLGLAAHDPYFGCLMVSPRDGRAGRASRFARHQNLTPRTVLLPRCGARQKMGEPVRGGLL
jgi:hypothetical protein